MHRALVPGARMMPRSILPIAVAAVACFTPSPSSASEAGPPPPLSIRIEIRRPLRLGRSGLAGVVRATLTNTTATALRVFHEDSNGLVFRSVEDGSLHVAYHSCACLQNSPPSRGESRTVPPRGSVVLTFADWGCSGSMFAPPPEGTYEVTYRAFLAPHPHAASPSPGGRDIRTSIARCRAELESETYWKGAVASPARRVVVRRGR
jgi:hypothetical protein